jgi:predicted dehydrogenase
MMAEMLDAIEQRRAPMNAGASGVRVMRLIDAVLAGVATGRFVRPAR